MFLGLRTSAAVNAHALLFVGLRAPGRFARCDFKVQTLKSKPGLLFLVTRHINARLDAVSELAGDLSPEADATRALMKKLPDVERLLSRVHSMASRHRSSEHPESRAIMYEDNKYSIRKVYKC